MKREVHGATDNAHSDMVDAAMVNGCGRGLIGDVTAGRLQRRRTISASSSAIFASARLWVREYDGMRSGGAARGVETECNS